MENRPQAAGPAEEGVDLDVVRGESDLKQVLGSHASLEKSEASRRYNDIVALAVSIDQDGRKNR